MITRLRLASLFASVLVQEPAGTEHFNPGDTIIEHVSNSGHDHPLIHLPTVFGIDFSVTKHVFMLWLVAAIVFVVVTWNVRRYLQQNRLIPSGFMNGLEAVVEFVRNTIVLPNVGSKWVNTWSPLIHVRQHDGVADRSEEPRLNSSH